MSRWRSAKDNARTKGEAEARRIVQQAQRQADQVFAELDELRKQQQRSDYQAVNDRKKRYTPPPERGGDGAAPTGRGYRAGTRAQ